MRAMYEISPIAASSGISVSWSSNFRSAPPPSFREDEMDTHYSQIITLHKENLTLKNGQVSDQVFRNHTSALKAYLVFCNRDLTGLVSREFTVDFLKKSKGFAEFVALQNRKTAADKLSILRTWKRTIDFHARSTVLKSMGGQSLFHKELRIAVASSGLSLREIAAAINSDSRTITSWHDGVMPYVQGLPAVRRLEKLFGVEPGYFEKKLVFPRREVEFLSEAPPDRFEVRFREALKDPYYVPTSSFTESLLEEWAAFVEFKTCLHPVNLKRSAAGMWRTLPTEKVDNASRRELLTHTSPGYAAPSARATLTVLRSFLGFLTKPKGTNRANSGLALRLSDVDSLASFAIPEFVAAYLEFMKARSGNILHNGIANTAGIIIGLCRKSEGYLWQQPNVFLERVATYAKGRSWEELCQKNVELCKSWQDKAIGKKSRDPEDNLAGLFALKDMLDPFKTAIRKLDLAAAGAMHGSVQQAIYKRDALIMAINLFNPLRLRTLSLIKYIKLPQQSRDMSNLYQTEDGQWWLRFEKGDFKNDESKPENYNSPITRGLDKRIQEYLDIYRPTLIRHNPAAINLFVTKAGTPMLDIGHVISRIAKNYIPIVRRLRPHALRHVVATDFLRKNPGKYTLLAGLLHDTLQTVLKTYAHGKTESAFRAQEENMKDFYEGL